MPCPYMVDNRRKGVRVMMNIREVLKINSNWCGSPDTFRLTYPLFRELLEHLKISEAWKMWTAVLGKAKDI